MDGAEDEGHFIPCSDILSLVLLGFALSVADIDPRRRIWGRSLQRRALIVSAIAINVIFSLFRLIFECARVDTGPREFLLASVVYCSRWIWLYIDLSRSRPRKAFEIARHLKDLKMIRLRTSTRRPSSGERTRSGRLCEYLRDLTLRVKNWRRADEPEAQASTEQGLENDDGRNGQTELVVRSGARTLPPHGVPYWRGVEDIVETYASNGDTLHFVRLVERELHSSQLDEIGTYEYKRRLDIDGIDGLYKKIYDLVMTCDAQESDFKIDYTPFLSSYGVISIKTNLARRTGSVSETPLGGIARRFAADACYYVTNDDAELRTGNHVTCINECMEEAARTRLRNYQLVVPNNRDSNV